VRVGWLRETLPPDRVEVEYANGSLGNTARIFPLSLLPFYYYSRVPLFFLASFSQAFLAGQAVVAVLLVVLLSRSPFDYLFSHVYWESTAFALAPLALVRLCRRRVRTLIRTHIHYLSDGDLQMRGATECAYISYYCALQTITLRTVAIRSMLLG